MRRSEEVVSITEAMRAFRLTRWFHGLRGGPYGMKKLWAQPVCLIPCLFDQSLKRRLQGPGRRATIVLAIMILLVLLRG